MDRLPVYRAIEISIAMHERVFSCKPATIPLSLTEMAELSDDILGNPLHMLTSFDDIPISISLRNRMDAIRNPGIFISKQWFKYKEIDGQET